jgi:hypothetical protein
MRHVFFGSFGVWERGSKGILKGELKRRNVTYADLSKRLIRLGVHETERNLRNKISRGNFSAIFLFQCLVALDVQTLHIDPGLFARQDDPEESGAGASGEEGDATEDSHRPEH